MLWSASAGEEPSHSMRHVLRLLGHVYSASDTILKGCGLGLVGVSAFSFTKATPQTYSEGMICNGMLWHDYCGHDPSTSNTRPSFPASADLCYHQNTQPWHRTTLRQLTHTLKTLIGYQFVNTGLLEEALHAVGPTFIGDKLITEANKRLAVIGDSALDLALSITEHQNDLSRGMPLPSAVILTLADSFSGALSDHRSSIASNEDLSAVGVANRIDACTRCNAGITSVSLNT